MATVFRAAFFYDADAVSRETGLLCDDESLTQQQFAEESDINTIVRRFGLTGELPEAIRMPMSGDFTGVSDFKTAVDMVIAAEEAFMLLPGEMRARFGNDPGELIAFLDDPKNVEEARTLGLVNKPIEKTRDVVQAVDELAARIAPQPKA